MSETAERIKGEIMALSPEDRAELIRFLLSSPDEGPADPAVEAAWDAELDRRVNDIESGKVVGVPAEQVFAELRKKHP
jgi:putative addiction module component (TIGR02574 family)